MRKLIHFGLWALLATTTTALADDSDWVTKSNEHAQVVLEVLAKFSPEGAGRMGVDGLDEEVSTFGPGFYERSMEVSRDLLEELKKRDGRGQHPIVGVVA